MTDRKLMECLSRSSPKCKKLFKTTPDRRFCEQCMWKFRQRKAYERNGAISPAPVKKDTDLMKFWSNLK